jgi:hypothetical protein
MVLSDLNLLVISSFVPIASILPSLIAMAVLYQGVVHGIYRGIRNYRINSSFVFFKQETRENKTK